MVLNGEDRQLSMPETFDGPIVEIEVGDFETWSAWNPTFFSRNGEPMVLRRNENASCLKLADWVIPAAMAVWKLGG